MAFRIGSGRPASPDDPESLLRDLRKKTIPGLLSHQADLLRSYLDVHTKFQDIALQLPTGSGKTLGWRLEYLTEGDVAPMGRSSVNGTTLALSHAPPTKQDASRTLVWVTTSPSAISAAQLDERRLSPAVALGRCPWGEVYFWSAIASPEELSTVRRMTATALEIDGR